MLISTILASLALMQAQPERPPECDGDDGTACFNAAFQMDQSNLRARGVRAMAFARACELEMNSGCFNAGIILSQIIGDMGQSQMDDAAVVRTVGTSTQMRAMSRDNFVRGCELGHQRACAQASTALQSGFGGGVDHQRAVEMEVLGCEAGAAELCRWAGTTYAGTELGQPDYNASLRYFLMACDGGIESACTSARSVMVDGNGRPVRGQLPQAVSVLAGECEGDEVNSAACSLRDYFVWIDRDNDATPAVDTGLLHRAEARCQSEGLALWCYEVGGMYSIMPLGLNTGQIYAGRLYSYAQACEQGYDRACTNYDQVVASVVEGQTEACADGNANACGFVQMAEDPSTVDDYFVRTFGLVPLSVLQIQDSPTP